MNFEFLESPSPSESGEKAVRIPDQDALWILGKPDPVPLTSLEATPPPAQASESGEQKHKPTGAWAEAEKEDTAPTSAGDYMARLAEKQSTVARIEERSTRARRSHNLLVELAAAQKSLPDSRAKLERATAAMKKAFADRQAAPKWAIWMHHRLDHQCNLAAELKVKSQNRLWAVQKIICEWQAVGGSGSVSHFVDPTELAVTSTALARAEFGVHVARGAVKAFIDQWGHLMAPGGELAAKKEDEDGDGF